MAFERSMLTTLDAMLNIVMEVVIHLQWSSYLR